MADIQELLRKVRESGLRELDEDTRRELQRPETIAISLELLRNNDWDIRSDALWGLWGAGAPAIPGLLEALQDESWNVRNEAAETLGLIGDPSAVPALIETLLRGDEGAFEYSAYALEMIAQEQDDVPKLRPLLNHNDPHIRLVAAYALGEKAGEDGIQGFIDLVRYGVSGDVSEFEIAARCLSEIGQPAIPVLIDILQNDDNEVIRRLAAQVLSTIGDPSALPAMIGTMNDESSDVRQDVVSGLGAFGEAALPILIEAIVSDDLVTSGSAHWALRNIGTKAAEDLFKLLDHDDDGKRKLVASTLWVVQIDSRSHDMLNRLIDSLQDESINVQRGAAEVLLLIRTPEALAAVEEWRRKQES